MNGLICVIFYIILQYEVKVLIIHADMFFVESDRSDLGVTKRCYIL